MEDGRIPQQPGAEAGGGHQGVRHTEPEECRRGRETGRGAVWGFLFNT